MATVAITGKYTNDDDTDLVHTKSRTFLKES